MAAPTVTRPLINPPEKTAAGMPMEEMARYARWVVLGVIVVGTVGLIAAIAVSWSDQRQNEQLRQSWDEIYKATKDKNKLSDRISSLEEVVPKVVGTPAHGYAVMALGNLYFEQAVNPKLARDERTTALDKATQLYVMLATSEPFKSNPGFGPVAVRCAATAYEQAGKYDDAIKLLSATIAEPDMARHFAFNQLEAQLGRVYWLRSLTKTGTEAENDRKEARKQLSEALRAATSNDRGGEGWRQEAEFIRANVDKPGKALAGGVIPPEKRSAEPEKKDDAKKTDDKADAKDPKKDAAPAVAPKADAPKPDAPKDEKKDDKKVEEPKKSGGANIPEDPAVPANSSPSGHLTFSQLQKALKEGRTGFCNCARCQAGMAPPAGVRLAE